MDEVDHIIDAWRRELPDVDVEPLRVLSRVSRIALHLDRVRKEAFSAHQLDLWEFDVLAALHRSGAPYELSPGELIEQMMSTSGTMTNRIDRLAGRGLVERLPDPHDRRGVRVKLAPAGRKLVRAALADLVEMEVTILDSLSADERETVTGLLRRLLGGFEQRRAGK